MKRRQLFELHDLDLCPAGARDAMTDFMSWFATVSRIFRPVHPLLQKAVRDSGARRIVDLCSGGGSPSLGVVAEFRRRGDDPPPIVLTDKYPNLAAWRSAAAACSGTISFVEESVDATNVPQSLHGFRTLYASFHHFDPEAARSIIGDAVNKREGIGIFEYTERNFLIWGVPLLLTPLFVILAMPLVRPFRWQRLLWTYVIPLAPLMALWDGFVSCLRTYTAPELLRMAEEAGGDTYEWQAGRVRAFGASHVTYLIGCPRPA